MSDRERERLGAASGIAFVALLLVVLIFFPAPPDFNASAPEIAEYYIDHRDAIQISNLIGAAALFFLIWFMGSVRSVLIAAEGGTGRLSAIAFGGGLVGVATFFFGVIMAAAAAFRPEETTPDNLRLLHDINFALAFALGGLAFAAFFAATALVSLQTGAFPAPLGWLAAATAIALGVGGATIFDDSGAFSADGFFGILPVIAVLVWVLAASAFLVSRPAGAARGHPGNRL